MALGQVAVLHSLDTREAVEEYLSSRPATSSGSTCRACSRCCGSCWTVTAVAAAAAAVLGWYALQRSQGARLALSVLAVPLFLTSFSFGGLPVPASCRRW